MSRHLHSLVMRSTYLVDTYGTPHSREPDLFLQTFRSSWAHSLSPAFRAITEILASYGGDNELQTDPRSLRSFPDFTEDASNYDLSQPIESYEEFVSRYRTYGFPVTVSDPDHGAVFLHSLPPRSICPVDWAKAPAWPERRPDPIPPCFWRSKVNKHFKAAVVPSLHGKTSLAKAFPNRFADIDDLAKEYINSPEAKESRRKALETGDWSQVGRDYTNAVAAVLPKLGDRTLLLHSEVTVPGWTGEYLFVRPVDRAELERRMDVRAEHLGMSDEERDTALAIAQRNSDDQNARIAELGDGATVVDVDLDNGRFWLGTR